MRTAIPGLVLTALLATGPALAECEQGKLLASEGAAGDKFGVSVAVSGEVAVIGSSYDDDGNAFDSGSAYVFRYDGSNWVQEAKLLPSDGGPSGWFGCAVAVSGDVALIGAHGVDDSSSVDFGSAYVFRYDGSNWVQEAKLRGSRAWRDFFGYSVAISGDIALIGVPLDDDDSTSSGSAYIFRYDGSSWVQEAKLLGSDLAAYDYFGMAVAVSGQTALIGAYRDDDKGTDSGSVYVFRYDGSTWIEEQKLLASDGAAGDYFGWSLAVSGDTAVIGADCNDDGGSNSGSAYVFRYDPGPPASWVQDAKLLASDGAASDFFGCSVAISGGTAVVGARYDDDKGTDSGSAYVFRYDPGPPASWVQDAKLLAFDGGADEWFGHCMAIYGDTGVIGAFCDDENGRLSGSAYGFSLTEAECNGNALPEERHSLLIGANLDADCDMDATDFMQFSITPGGAEIGDSLAIACVGTTTVTTWKNDCIAAISLTYDGLYNDHLFISAPAMSARGLQGTYFVMPGLWSEEYDYIGRRPSTFVTIAEDGHELGAHTMYHTHCAILAPEDDPERRYFHSLGELIQDSIDVKAILDPLQPGTSTQSHAYPWGWRTNEAAQQIATLFLTGRRCTGGPRVEPPSPADMYGLQTNMVGGSDAWWEYDYAYTQLTEFIGLAISSGGWMIEVLHEIQPPGYSSLNVDAYYDHLDDLVSGVSIGELWVAPQGDVARYIYSRDAALVTLLSVQSELIELTLDDGLPADIFNVPLTVQTEIPIDWGAAILVQHEGSSIQNVVLTENGKTYVQYSVPADGGTVRIRPMFADFDGDGDVDGRDFLTFSTCFNGSLRPPTPSCETLRADLDNDNDVDGKDFITFSRCFSGSLRPPKCL